MDPFSKWKVESMSEEKDIATFLSNLVEKNCTLGHQTRLVICWVIGHNIFWSLSKGGTYALIIHEVGY